MPPSKKARQLLQERQRIDEAMEVIDIAKQKARSQREEYGKFLNWKVAMQRKERKEREIEQDRLRERVDERLRAVLDEHRARKKDELRQWGQFATASPPKTEMTRTRQILIEEEEERRHEQALKEERHHFLKTLVRSKKGAAVPHSAPGGHGRSLAAQAARLQSGHDEGVMMASASAEGGQQPYDFNDTSMLNASLSGGGTAASGAGPLSPGGTTTRPQKTTLKSATNQGGGAKRKAATQLTVGGYDPSQLTFKAITENSKREGQMDQAALKAACPMPEYTDVTATSALSPPQAEALAAVERRKDRTDKRRTLVEDMNQAAKNRRLYAMGKMLADPPADYLIGTDLLRYIPAEVLSAAVPEEEDTRPPPKPTSPDGADGPAFFMTQVEHQQARRIHHASAEGGGGGGEMMQVEDGDGDEERVGGGATVPRAPQRATGRSVHRPKAFDPLAWMKAPANPAPPLQVPPRQPEEERATLEWYKTVHEPLLMRTNHRRRDMAARPPVQWRPVERHNLPEKASLKFDSA